MNATAGIFEGYMVRYEGNTKSKVVYDEGYEPTDKYLRCPKCKKAIGKPSVEGQINYACGCTQNFTQNEH